LEQLSCLNPALPKPNSEEDDLRMTNARNKLNAASIRGVLLLARLIALVAGSWSIFWLLVAVLLVTSLMEGDLRLRGPHR